ncbi:MAG: hypothetical protein FWD76_06205 [Firmicutes bacterium]|nr:hypothetical protein [Bacillota bacterium]
MNKNNDKYEKLVIDRQDPDYLVQLSFCPQSISLEWYSKKPYDVLQSCVDELLGYPQNVPIGVEDLFMCSADGFFFAGILDQDTESEDYQRVKPLVIEWFKKFYAEHKEIFHKEIKEHLEINKEYMEEDLAQGMLCWEDDE